MSRTRQAAIPASDTAGWSPGSGPGKAGTTLGNERRDRHSLTI
jgi:hypothetical protein